MSDNDVKKKQIFTLSTGVKFSVGRQVPPLLLMDAMDSVPDPVPPQIEVTGMGGRKVWRENPDDPYFVEKRESVALKRNMLVARLIMQMSLNLETPLPEGDDWLKRPMREMGEKIEQILQDEGGKEYLFLRYVGVQTGDDISLIVKSSSVTEEGVSEKTEAFQG